ncbi:MAG: flagellar basal body P-ring formation chaperone FlgA [Phycisphaerae bacterium]
MKQWTPALLLLLCAAGPEAYSGDVRLWPSAVVVTDKVVLRDLCELSGIDAGAQRELSSLVITSAPPVGGSRLIDIDVVRAALTQAGVNMARVTLRGATQCAVSRPSSAPPAAPASSTSSPQALNGAVGSTVGSASVTTSYIPRTSLRRAVVDYFNGEFARYGGTAELVFDRASDQVLGLGGPPYEFNVRRRGRSLLGLTSLEVDVLSKGSVVQTVPMAVQVSMLKNAVVARRAISQGATIRRADVGLLSMSVTRLDRLGFSDVDLAIGQRAKRFIPTGTLIEQAMLESVPLVRRGDYVKLISAVGFVRVVTAARATEDGVLGDIITIRAADDKRVEFDAVVVGPGAVQIGAGLSQRIHSKVASGSSEDDT